MSFQAKALQVETQEYSQTMVQVIKINSDYGPDPE